MANVDMQALDSAITDMVMINEIKEELMAGQAPQGKGYAVGALTIEGLDRELSRAIRRVNEVMKGAAPVVDATASN